MKTCFDCVPCLIRQMVDTARLCTSDDAVIEDALRQCLAEMARMDLGQSPPALGWRLYRLILDRCGATDPLRDMKAQSNRFALSLYPELKASVNRAPDPFAQAARLAIAGNIIDFGAHSSFSEARVRQSIAHALEAPLDPVELDALRHAAASARRILYLADNAGEIVLDKLLIERLGPEKVTVVVRGGPIINDATLEDARAAGLTGMVEVMDNGAPAAGTILDLCSPGLRQRFAAADLVIAKGQGNYETLSHALRPVYFLLKAKCPVVARSLRVKPGDIVLRRGGAA
ncbi:MAG TPA: ARMT1-like domain-containing protein [Candidatus Brocadiia bacterium]|nr:ARMT1-like domain-containing protein [Candidatus Brocadiia bacterium]